MGLVQELKSKFIMRNEQKTVIQIDATCWEIDKMFSFVEENLWKVPAKEESWKTNHKNKNSKHRGKKSFSRSILSFILVLFFHPQNNKKKFNWHQTRGKLYLIAKL